MMSMMARQNQGGVARSAARRLDWDWSACCARWSESRASLDKVERVDSMCVYLKDGTDLVPTLFILECF